MHKMLNSCVDVLRSAAQEFVYLVDVCIAYLFII